jgi:ABC-type Mn2+/Zn2+ transport system ATPase subunit
MITRIEASRYRCFERLALDLGPYQVLVGRNGAGKSTVLDIPVLLGEIFEKRSIEKPFFGDRGRLAPRAASASDLVFSGKGDWFSFAVEARLPEFLVNQLERKTIEYLNKREQGVLQRNPGRAFGMLRYEIGFRIADGAMGISHEYLFLLPKQRELVRDAPEGLWGDIEFPKSKLVRRIIQRSSDNVSLLQPEVGKSVEPTRANVPPSTPALSGVPLDLGLYATAEWFRTYLGHDVLAVNLDLPAMRSARRPPGAKFVVESDGTTLPWSVLDLERRPDAHREWVEHVRGALPLLQNVRAHQREDDRHAYLEVEYATGYKVRSIGLSDGTLSLLALSILPFLDNVPSFVTVEEPENGIHPKAIEVILESLQAVEDRQVLVTTHSPIVVAISKLQHLVCLSMTKNDGVQVLRGTEHPTLSSWKGVPTLDVLFNAGVL